MAKITRTFRLDKDLIERFDSATEAAGVDKTAVVTEAIKKFVEAVEMKRFWNTDNLVIIKDVYAPVLGKAIAVHGEANLNEDLKIVQTALRGFNAERKDEEGTRYNIDHAFATIDFENKVCSIEFKKFWIGGLVEKEEITFPIEWTETVDNILSITDISVFEKKTVE